VSQAAEWVKRATRAAADGRWQEAEHAWRRVLALEPGHVQALYSVGVHAFRSGQFPAAIEALRAAWSLAPGEPAIALSIARVLREQHDAEGERGAIEAALAVDPYFLPALLAKADWLERTGNAKAAVAVYRNALKVAPAESGWPAALRAQLAHGQAMVRSFGEQLAAFLLEGAGSRVRALRPHELERWREAGAILAGQSQAYPSICNQLQVPRLPAIPFFERERFDWVEELEACTGDIVEEMRAALGEDGNAFQPYVAYAAGTPVNQWHELNHSRRWSSYFLWRNGTALPEHLARCPSTALALERVGLARIDGMCPNAMFSALAPRTRIPPHTGDTNARLVVHLPLVVPDNCLYRVGFEERRWKVGEVLIFDDSIEHEARNDSDELRVVLIFDVWNPLLSEAEREMVRFLTARKAEFDFEG
jgi:aspartate beta-hydroxylase